MQVSNSGSNVTGLPDTCKPGVIIVASPVPLPARWGGACSNTVGSVCSVYLTDDVTITVDFTRP